jgi:hypothetical protein
VAVIIVKFGIHGYPLLMLLLLPDWYHQIRDPGQRRSDVQGWIARCCRFPTGWASCCACRLFLIVGTFPYLLAV